MTQLRIELTDGKWLVNGRSYKELSFTDRDLLNGFFKALKNDVLEFEESQDKYINFPLVDELSPFTAG